MCAGHYVPAPAPIDDSVVVWRSGETAEIAWTDSPGPYNVYRGAFGPLAGLSYDHGCLDTGGPITATMLADPQEPGAGHAYYYLVTRVAECRESIPGTDSNGSAIPNPSACPEP